MTINDVLNKLGDVPVTQIKVILIKDGQPASERLFDKMKAQELYYIVQKKVITYYQLGNFWYILSNLA